jgi:hypothetical protein
MVLLPALSGEGQPCFSKAPLSHRMHMSTGTKLPPIMPPMHPPPHPPLSSSAAVGGEGGGGDGGKGEGGSEGGCEGSGEGGSEGGSGGAATATDTVLTLTDIGSVESSDVAAVAVAVTGIRAVLTAVAALWFDVAMSTVMRTLADTTVTVTSPSGTPACCEKIERMLSLTAGV